MPRLCHVATAVRSATATKTILTVALTLAFVGGSARGQTVSRLPCGLQPVLVQPAILVPEPEGLTDPRLVPPLPPRQGPGQALSADRRAAEEVAAGLAEQLALDQALPTLEEEARLCAAKANLPPLTCQQRRDSRVTRVRRLARIGARSYSNGTDYRVGHIVAQDSEQAIKHYRTSAQMAYPPAMLALAQMLEARLEAGVDVPADRCPLMKAEVEHWYRRWAKDADKFYIPEYRKKVLAEHNIQP